MYFIMTDQNIVYIQYERPSFGYSIGLFTLECLVVFSFLFCFGFCICCRSICGNSKLKIPTAKFKVKKYQDLTSLDEISLQSYVNSSKKSKKLVEQQILPNESVQIEEKTSNQVDESSSFVEQNSENINDSITTSVANAHSVNIQNDQQQDSTLRKIGRMLTCGCCFKKSKSIATLEDVENKKKKYLLYKFNNLNVEETFDDPTEYVKLDPYNDLKEFTKIIYNSYDPSDLEILLYISSPGGIAYKFEEVYSYVDRLRKKGFIITAIVDDFCASGGYMLASACNKIIAAPCAQIGSVGVICTAFNYHELTKKIGIAQKTFKTGKDKEGFPSGEEFTEEDVQRMNEKLHDTLKIFGRMVKNARNLTDEEMGEILTAKVWYAEDALSKKLIDKISLSVDYYSDLLTNGDIYVVIPEPQKKSLLNGLLKLSAIPEIFNKFTDDNKLGITNMIKLE